MHHVINPCASPTNGTVIRPDWLYIWVAIAYASRFLNSLEEKYSVNELELLGVVWAIEHFKYYLYGKNITIITNHQALISALNASKRSMASQSISTSLELFPPIRGLENF